MGQVAIQMPTSEMPTNPVTIEKAKTKFKGRIVLLEDDELLASGLCRQLAQLGIECIWANNLEQAFSIVNNGQVHAIVTDVYLKNSTETGLDLVTKCATLGLPMVIITSNPNLDIAKKAMNHGASYLFQKPFEAKDLFEILNNLWMEPKNHIGMLERFMELNELTAKEREITRLLLKGLSNSEIASALKISDKTVKFHFTTIFGKCGVHSRTELYSSIFPT